MLSRRALNRATLARQGLLDRTDATVTSLVEHLVGLQAQTPHTWYVGLWARLAEFRPEEASSLLESRQLVRIALMRSTIHLVTADDALTLRPLFQPVLERAMAGNFGKHLIGIDRGELAAAGRQVLEEQPRTFSELGQELARRWPDRDAASLAQAIRASVPMVQVPPRGLWGRSGASRHVTLEAWLGSPTTSAGSVDDLILRYLRAFGPATVKDVQAWSGLTRLAEVIDRLRAQLVTFQNEDGRELFDLPDAPRPDPDTPAPARFLYDYDNLLLSHADRSRVITPTYFSQGFTMTGPMPRIVLLDGETNGTWLIDRHGDTATLTIQPFSRLAALDEEALTVEGRALLAFIESPATTHDIRFLPPR
jgi:Winged helix DNA-binding domain